VFLLGSVSRGASQT